MTTVPHSSAHPGNADAPAGRGAGVVMRAGRRSRSIGVVILCSVGSIMALGTALVRFEERSPTGEMTPTQDVIFWLALLGAVGVIIAVRKRHEAPLVVTLITAAVPLLLPLDATAALFALAALIRSRTGPPDRTVWGAGLLVVAATTVSLYRDASGATSASSVLKILTAPPRDPGGEAVPSDLAMWVPGLVAVLLVGAAVGSGVFMRSRLALTSTQVRAVAAERSTEVLTDRLGRQAERDRIAREVHDVIGHRLSLLSLHAGGLEVAAGDDAQLARSAALVRENAQQAMDDLRSLLVLLREPEVTLASPTATPSLADLPSVIEDTVASGIPVISTVFLQQAEEADEGLARAVYRIVQELLTNARRHAPGAPVRLDVQGGPGTGVTIATANHLTTGGAGPRGNGLTGISERVALLGGTMQSGVDEQHAFRVSVWLPWHARGGVAP